MVVSPIEATSQRPDRLSLDLAHAEAREGEAQFAGELTGEGLYGDDDTGGKDTRNTSAYL
jgi:hypothetical protein